jgi:hypothetical protein
MRTYQHPDKQQVREWLQREIAAKRPPLSQEEIRRQLGFGFNKGAERSR